MKPGDRVSNRYKIIEKIGSGGMANVYLAKDLILERKVAVKMIALDFKNDKDSLRRFQREALATSELTHPNIVSIYDVGEGDHPYIVMEYVDGMELKQYIKQNHPIPYKKVIDIMSQLLDGIEYAHRKEIIHRDIKPHNILIDKEGNVKITDFGIAVALSQNSITQTNSMLGSVQYISPEQARGNIVTKQSDIYSLGIVLYELLTGNVPFDGESAVSIALKHFQADIPSLLDYDSRIPQALENVVLKATAKETKDRYTTVVEMKNDLITSLSPERRNEAKFIPIDTSEEATLVLDVDQFKSEEAKNKKDEKKGTIDKPIKVNNKKSKKKKKWWMFLIPIILLFILIIFLLSRPDEIVIPEELIGMTQEEAMLFLEDYALELGEIIEEPNDEVDEGLIYRVNPDVGDTVLEGSEIDLYISLGKEPFEIEDYIGKSYEEIRAKLTEVGLKVEMIEESSSEYEEGKIIAQDIQPGTEVDISDTLITFTVSTGRPSFELRDLSGYTEPSVKDYVESVGLNLSSKEEYSDDIPIGQVISQEPAAGTKLYQGANITIIFSKGPKEKSDINFSKKIKIPYREEYKDSDDEDEKELIPAMVRIYVDDLKNDINSVAHEFEIKEDTSFVLNFIVKDGENAKYRVDVNDKKVLGETVSP